MPHITKNRNIGAALPAKKRPTRIIENRLWVIAGILLLIPGVLIYLAERDPAAIYFTRWLGIEQQLFGPGFALPASMGDVLPAFFHVLGFSLITAAFTTGTRRQCALICFGWFAINAILELGQKFKETAVQLTPAFFDHLPFLESTRAFFQKGTFDVLDIAAAGAGAAVAFLMMRLTAKNSRR